MSAEAKVKELGLVLPPAPKPAGNYVPVVRTGNLLFVSGHGPLQSDGKLIEGRVGDQLDVEAAYAAARQTGLAILSSLRTTLGTLDAIERLVKVLGLVYATSDFRDQPKVINGFSDLMVEVFGEERGRAARSAVGAGSLPGNIPVEVEAIFELRE